MKYLKLIRVHQWYKNLVIFLPILFAGELFNFNGLFLTILGFLALSFVSSANYVLNDLIDREKDKLHPEKKKRPLASGQISTITAIILVVILLSVGLAIGFSLSVYFAALLVLLVVLTQIYSLWLKNEAFVDILLIASNFVLRSVSGALVIWDNGPWVEISPWLILCPFFLSLFLSSAKREADMLFLGQTAKKFRKVYSQYTKELTHSVLLITTALLIMSYSLYSFFSKYNLLLTLPFSLYLIFRYLYLVESGSAIARRPHLAIKDLRMVIACVLWGMIAFAIIYL